MLLSGIFEKELSKQIRLTYFDVIEYDDFAECLDQHLVSVWFGPKEKRRIEIAKNKNPKLFRVEIDESPFTLRVVRGIFSPYLFRPKRISTSVSRLQS